MDDERINHLSFKLLNGTITPEERQELEEWYNSFDDAEDRHSAAGDKTQFSERLYGKISKEAGLKPVKQIRYIRYAVVAASILLFLTATIYYRQFSHYLKPDALATQPVKDIGPGGNKAMLTLANGKTINLESAAKGVLPTGDNHSLTKEKDGFIAYDKNDKGDNNTNYNLLTTPRGGQYSIRLADGTLAILDAESSIRYPSAFNTEKRVVEVTGQVYFEVVHDSKHPFIVKTNGQIIEDLGTHFNINAYTDANALKTTLEEGSVSITTDKKTIFLKPGQAAIKDVNSNLVTVTAADLEEVLAWKNGYFRFNDEHIENIMAQVSRWYNVDVVYAGKLPADGFNGTISRSKNITQVLKMLERTGVIHFKIEGRRITVLP